MGLCLFPCGVWPEVSQHWSLMGGAKYLWENCGLQEGSCQRVFPRAIDVFVPAVSHNNLLAANPPVSASKSGLGSLKSLLFSLSSGVHTTLCLPFRSVVSIYSSLMEFLWTSPTGNQSQILWGFLLLVLDRQAGDSDMGCWTFTSVKRSSVI